MNNFESLTDEELYFIDGGRSNYGFGYEVGKDIRDGVDYVVDHITSLIPCEPAY